MSVPNDGFCKVKNACLGTLKCHNVHEWNCQTWGKGFFECALVMVLVAPVSKSSVTHHSICSISLETFSTAKKDDTSVVSISSESAVISLFPQWQKSFLGGCSCHESIMCHVMTHCHVSCPFERAGSMCAFSKNFHEHVGTQSLVERMFPPPTEPSIPVARKKLPQDLAHLARRIFFVNTLNTSDVLPST